MASYRFKAPASLHKQRFDHVVHALLNEKVEGGVSKSMARKLVMVGACYLGGSRCRIASKPVWQDTEVRVEYNPANVPVAQVKTEPLDESRILYREGGLIVVDKPAGLPTVPTLDNARDDLVSALKTFLGKDQYLGIHHRLDAGTSGCILFTTDEAQNVTAAKLFQEDLIQKEYLAICSITEGNPPKQWEIKNQLVRAEKKKNRYASSTSEGSFAYSRFELLQIKDGLALIKAMPITGRTHQLRVHLSEYGLPILGDRLYKGAEANRLMLHAQRLTFRLPGAAAETVVEAPIPVEFKKLFGL